MKKIVYILIFLNPLYGVIAQSDSLLRPHSNKENAEIIKHTYYELEYDETHEQAAWVFYVLTPKFINGTAIRKNKFKPDTAVSTGSAQLIDYKKSGYDRGHICPAGDMKINQLAMDESFYMSNMSPQLAAFNRGKWKQLEGWVRKWVIKEKLLYVVSGGIFTDSLGVIGVNKVTIPAYFYKVIYAPKKKEMLAFIMPNRKIENSILDYAVTVNEVEQRTGIDFFSGLPDEVELKLENEIVCW